jgi:hypothetical protein
LIQKVLIYFTHYFFASLVSHDDTTTVFAERKIPRSKIIYCDNGSMDFVDYEPDDRLDLTHDPFGFPSADIGCWLTDPSFDLSPADSIYPFPPQSLGLSHSGILHPSFTGPFDLSHAYPLDPSLAVEIDSVRVDFYFIFMAMMMMTVVLIPSDFRRQMPNNEVRSQNQGRGYIHRLQNRWYRDRP